MSSTTNKRSKKPFAIVALAALLIGGGGAAFAYWTTTGAGSGTATTATTTSAVTINQTGTITGLRPGSPAQTLTGTFNNGNTGPVYIATVTASINATTGVVPATGAVGTCTSSDYVINNAISTVAADIPAGNAQGLWGTGANAPTIAFVNKGTNQDGCKGATVNITYTAN